LARGGSGQAGSDWSYVRPTMPVNAVPGVYSFNYISFSFILLLFFPEMEINTFLYDGLPIQIILFLLMWR